MSTLTIMSRRSDGKYKVRLSFAGAPNAFGGRECGKVFNKLMDTDKLLVAVARPGVDTIYYGSSLMTPAAMVIVLEKYRNGGN